MIGKSGADAFFAAEVPHFPGRLGIMHRDLPEMVARGYADVALRNITSFPIGRGYSQITSSWCPLPGAERFFVKIAFARVIDPMRPRALKAFEEFFFSRARDVYPKYDFARMSDDEYGATLALD